MLKDYFLVILMSQWDIMAAVYWLEIDFNEHTTLIPVITLCTAYADSRSIVRNLPGHLTGARLTSLIQSLIN